MQTDIASTQDEIVDMQAEISETCSRIFELERKTALSVDEKEELAALRKDLVFFVSLKKRFEEARLAKLLSNGNQHMDGREFEACIKCFLGCLPLLHNVTELCFVYNQLAVAFSALGDLKQAVQYRNMDLKLTIEHFGKNHTEYATSINNLGLMMYKLARFSKSVSLFEEALAIRTKQLGDSHTATRLTLEYLDMAKLGCRFGRGRSDVVSADFRQCEACGDISESKLICSGCKNAFYCGSNCQNGHWREHKMDCTSRQKISVSFAVPYLMPKNVIAKNPFEVPFLVNKAEKLAIAEFQKHNGIVNKKVMSLSDELITCFVECEELKLWGNQAFKEGNFLRALAMYNKALDLWAEYAKKHTNDATREIPVLLVECGANMGACFFEMGKFNDSEEMCTYALDLIGDYAKVRLRRAKCYEKQGMLEQSVADFRLYLDLEPNDDDVKQTIKLLCGRLSDQARACGDYKCENCGKGGLFRCSECTGVRYCSAECQFQHWNTHKKICSETQKHRKAEKAGTQSGIYAARKAGENASEISSNMFNYISVGSNGSWCFGLDEDVVFRRLRDSYRLRRIDVLDWKGEVIGSFTDFLKRAFDKCILPEWWKEEDHSQKCLRYASRKIDRPLAKQDVVARNGYQSGEHFVLRSLSASIYGVAYCSPIRGAPY